MTFINLLISLLLGLMAMALFTLLERRILGYAQLRKGPNKPSLMALLLPLADAGKLFSKNPLSNSHANFKLFLLAPILALACSLTLWALIPLFHPHTSLNNGILIFLALSSLHVYALLAMAWSSNSKYSTLGMNRALAQTLSYEISMALIFVSILLPMKTFNFPMILEKGFPLLLFLSPILLAWMITCLAETNRTPFDTAEGESELVSGFNTEYSAAKFAMIFMAEYLTIMVMSTMSVILFIMPGTHALMSLTLKILTVAIISTLFIAFRATLPRVRYDNLMWTAWAMILPLMIAICLMLVPLIS